MQSEQIVQSDQMLSELNGIHFEKVNLSCECISFSIMCGCVFGQQNFIFNGCARCHFRSVVIVKIKSNPQQFENYARVRFSLKLNAVRELFFICGMKNTEEKYLHFKCISQQNIYWHAKQEKEEKKTPTTTSNHLNCANFASFLRGTIFLSATFMSRYFECVDRAHWIIHTTGFYSFQTHGLST